MIEIQDDIPSRLLSVAFRAGKELAWPRQEALDMIDLLALRGLAVLGVEIWIPAGSGPEIPGPFIYTWEVQPKAEGETWSAFVARAEEQATAYVRDFTWDERDHHYRGREPFFNLTVSAESVSTTG